MVVQNALNDVSTPENNKPASRPDVRTPNTHVSRSDLRKVMTKPTRPTAREMVAMLSAWRHSGFNVFCGNCIQPKEKEAMETLARYIIRAPFAQEPMQYFADGGTVVYSAKDGKDRKIFDAPEWLAAMCSHVPNRREQMVRCYGYYSNVIRGKRRNEAEENTIPHIMESNTSSLACRKSWARLIQKIYNFLDLQDTPPYPQPT